MRMSPVAELRIANATIAEYQEALARAARQIYKLKQEVTGGMQVISFLASQCPDRTLTIKASDLIITAGSLQRKFDPETDVYSFIAVPPSPEEIAALQTKVEEVNDAHESPTVALGEPDPTEEVPPVALGADTARDAG